MICAAAAQGFSVSFNASHLLPPLIDLMQDPVVNVRIKVACTAHDCLSLCSDVQSQVCSMARDVCIIAEHGCVAEAGEESRLDRVKAILTRLLAQLLHLLQAFASHTCSFLLQLHRRQRQGPFRMRAANVQGGIIVMVPLLLFVLMSIAMFGLWVLVGVCQCAQAKSLFTAESINFWAHVNTPAPPCL